MPSDPSAPNRSPARAFVSSCGPLLRREGGAWRALDAVRVRRLIDTLAAGLRSYGLMAGDPVATLCGTSAEEWIAGLAIQSCGGVFVPLDPALPDRDLAYVLVEERARQVLVLDETQLARIVAMRTELPSLELALVFHAPEDHRPAAALAVETVCARGAAHLETDPALIDRPVPGLDDGGPACVLRGQGNRRVVLTNGNLTRAARTLAELLEIGGADTVLVRSAPGGFDRAAAHAAMLRGAGIAFSRSDEDSWDASAAVRPTVAILPREQAARWAARLGEAARRGRGPGRWLRRWAIAQGVKRASAAVAESRIPAHRPWGFLLAEWAALAAMRRGTGGRLRFLVSIGLPLPRSETDLLFALGIPVLEGCAAAESSGVLSLNTPARFCPGTGGRPVPGVEVRLSREGEVEVRGPLVGVAGEARWGDWVPTGMRFRLDERGNLVHSG